MAGNLPYIVVAPGIVGGAAVAGALPAAVLSNLMTTSTGLSGVSRGLPGTTFIAQGNDILTSTQRRDFLNAVLPTWFWSSGLTASMSISGLTGTDNPGSTASVSTVV